MPLLNDVSLPRLSLFAELRWLEPRVLTKDAFEGWKPCALAEELEGKVPRGQRRSQDGKAGSLPALNSGHLPAFMTPLWASVSL